MTKRKSINNDLQNITHKTNDRVTRTPLCMCTLKIYESDEARFENKLMHNI